MEALTILHQEWPTPNFNRASNWPEIGGKSTWMDIDEFTDTPQIIIRALNLELTAVTRQGVMKKS